MSYTQLTTSPGVPGLVNPPLPLTDGEISVRHLQTAALIALGNKLPTNPATWPLFVQATVNSRQTTITQLIAVAAALYLY